MTTFMNDEGLTLAQLDLQGGETVWIRGSSYQIVGPPQNGRVPTPRRGHLFLHHVPERVDRPDGQEPFDAWVVLARHVSAGSLGLAPGDQVESAVTRAHYELAEDGLWALDRTDHERAHRTLRLRVSRYRRRASSAETEWVERRSDEPGTHCVHVGDQFRGSMTYTIVATADEQGQWTLSREDGTRQYRRYARDVTSRAYKLATAGPPQPSVRRAPKITEVVCSSCGRGLGEFSDGTTPRNRLAECCEGTPTLWRRNDDDLYVGDGQVLREYPRPEPDYDEDEEEEDYDYEDEDRD